MKALILKDIIPYISENIVIGRNDITINKVMTSLSGITNNTLFFNQQGNIDLSQLSNFNEISIVTDYTFNIEDCPSNVTLIKVQNVNDAYWNFIKYYRSLFDIPVIGVTGTCGKTTTKEMIKDILSKKMKVQATYLSQNVLSLNLYYLLGINDDTKAAVIEMGVTHPGNLTTTCSYFQPTIGVITTIGVDHIEGCKSLDGYIKAKAELLAGLKNEGTLVLNADDENIKKIDLKDYKGKIIYFGLDENADFRILNIEHYNDGMKFSLKHNDKTHDFYIPVAGVYNVFNAAAALIVAYILDIDLDEAGKSLLTYKPIIKHFEILKGINGSTVIDDTWNINPTSVGAAIDEMITFANTKKKILVLASIAQLGGQSKELHYKVGKKVAESGIDILVTLGSTDSNVTDYTQDVKDGAIENGMNEKNIFCCNSYDEAFECLKNFTDSDSVVLIKASMYQPIYSLISRIVVTS